MEEKYIPMPIPSTKKTIEMFLHSIPNPSCSSTVKDEIDTLHKKQKISDEELSLITYSVSIDALPNEILMYIFQFLSAEDILQVRMVCSRWHQLAKSEVLWKYVTFKDISPSYFIGILLSLPPCVHHLKLECQALSVPVSLPEVMGTLYEHCPHLESLIIMNIHLVKNLHKINAFQTRRSQLLNMRLITDAKKTIKKPLMKNMESKFCKEEDLKLMNIVMPKLKVLSLKQVLFSRFHLYSHFCSKFFPNIVVLDLSYSKPISFSELKADLFSTLTKLEELYLAGWFIRDEVIRNILKNARKLRILDLEFSSVNDSTVEVCKQNGLSLEKLYLSHTDIGDICKTDKDKVFFPHLQVLCIKFANVTRGGIVKLLTACPSLQSVNVSFCEDVTDTWYNKELPKELQKRVVFDTSDALYCDHFLDSNHNFR